VSSFVFLFLFFFGGNSKKFYSLVNTICSYIYPPTFRAKLAEMWRIPEVNHWWLPNDEGYPAVVREIRIMTQERTNNPRDNFREDVRDMKSLFGNMAIKNTSSKESSPSADGDYPTELSPNQPSEDDTYF
jgi:hypothetical protein